MERHVIPLSSKSRLRKSSCNYLASSSSRTEEKKWLAAPVQEGIRLFQYSSSSGRLLDAFLVLRVSTTDLVRAIRWSPPAWSTHWRRGDTLALCFESRLELWSQSDVGKVFEKITEVSFDETHKGIQHIIWDDQDSFRIYICSASTICAIGLNAGDSISATAVTTCRGFGTRHPGGVSCSGGLLLAGNSYKELMATSTFNLRNECSQKTEKTAVVRCQAPQYLSPEEKTVWEEAKFQPCSIGCGGGICFLSLAHDATLSGSHEAGVSLRISGNAVADKPLVSILNSTTSDSNRDNEIKLVQCSSSERGQFPHSTYATSINETLSVGSLSPSIASTGVSPLLALQSISGVSNHRNVACESDAIWKKTGTLCAFKIERGSSESKILHDQNISWVGSTSVGEELGTHPDIIDVCCLDNGLFFLAIASSFSNKVILYNVSQNNELSKGLQVDIVEVFSLSDEGKCKGLSIEPAGEIVVLLALVAKPTSDSVASQSVSAEYSTSIEVLNIRNATIQNFQYRNPDPNATINSRISDASASAESKRDVFEFLVQMRQSIESRLDKLDQTVSKQGYKLDHLQQCVDNLRNS